ncbi:LysR family transcriptional regulator [Umezawaea sp.]|uniref:LysR family transcriptional regulator n=1 Tax=Umezawaea sp. TaxID=1955258 RepID=UPI002ED48238
MDLVGACRAFVSVSERGSFTLGAAAARIPQSVASRRIAALEEALGGRLFDRAPRRAKLTPFGLDVLPAAKRVVQAAEALEHDARRAGRRPLRLAVPDSCGTRTLARLDADARARGVVLDLRPAAPAERAELVRNQEVRVALTAVPAEEGTWSVPLGVASARPVEAATVYLDTLRPGRGGRAARRVWLQPEDDVPHVRDRIVRARDALGLRPSQVAVAGSLTSAVAEVLGSTDLLLCPAAQADELDLHWRPVGGLVLARGYDATAAIGDDADRIRTTLAGPVARCLGAEGVA